MNITDYNTKLSQSRQDYRDAANEMKENQRKEIEGLESKNDSNLTKVRSQFAHQKSELEFQNKELRDQFDSKTARTIKDKTDRFRTELKGERDQFDKDRTVIKTNLNERLSYLQDSYGKDLASRERNSDFKLKQAKDNYTDITDRNKKGFEKSIAQMDVNAKESVDKTNVQLNREQKKLIKEHSKTMQSIAEDGSASRNKILNMAQKNLSSVRETHSQEQSHANTHHNNRLKNVLNNKNQEIQVQRENFETIASAMDERSRRAAQQDSQRVSDAFTKKDRETSNAIYKITREANEKISGGSRAAIVESEKDRMAQSYENRISRLKNQQAQDNHHSTVESERTGLAFQDNVKESKIKHSNDIAKLEKSNRDFQKEIMTKTKKDTDTTVEAFRSELQKNKVLSQDNENRITNQFKTQIGNQRKNFGAAIEQLSEKNREAMESMQASIAKDKTEFIEKSRVDRHVELESVKQDFRTSNEKKVESMEQRLAHAHEQNDKDVKLFETRLDRLATKTNKELSVRSRMEDERRIEDTRGFKRELQAKDRQVALDKHLMKQDFEKKISNIKNTNEVRVDKLTERYETRYDNDITSIKREMNTKLKNMREQYISLSEQTQLEKEMIRSQYETRFDDMKQSHSMEVDRMAKERRYSKA